MPERAGEGQDALEYVDQDAGGGAPAVAFQVELAFEGGVDGLDDLSQRFEESGAGPVGLAFSGPSRPPGQDAQTPGGPPPVALPDRTVIGSSNRTDCRTLPTWRM